MLTITLFLLLAVGTVYFMIDNYVSFKVTRDSAYALFFTVAALVLICMCRGFLHFEPWKQFTI